MPWRRPDCMSSEQKLGEASCTAGSFGCVVLFTPLSSARPFCIGRAQRNAVKACLYCYGKGVAKISSKHQVTVPVAALEEAGVQRVYLQWLDLDDLEGMRDTVDAVRGT